MVPHKVDLPELTVLQIITGSKNLLVDTMPENQSEFPIKVGDILIIRKDVRRSVKGVRRYTSFKNMVGAEKHEKIYPGMSKLQVLRKLREQFEPRDERLGVVVLEIAPLLSIVQNKK
jgi:ASC-1-like (ASCH) protein